MYMQFQDSLKYNPLSYKKGYYEINGKFFTNKMKAMIEKSKTKKQIFWHFCKTTFDASCSKARLSIKLTDLYTLRAKQLREKYDYLILAYSGGADSDNILKTFQYNNIKLDEVWTDWPSSLIEKSNYVPTFSTEKTNMAIEWFAVVKPELDKLSKENPKIKIHVSDAFNYYGNVNGTEDYDDSGFVMHYPTTYYAIKRWRYLRDYCKKIRNTHKKICVITGVDKCIPFIKDNKYGFLLTDKGMCMTKYLDELDDDIADMEAFYWSPDFPEILTQQAHLLWDELFKDISLTQKLFDIREKNLDTVLKRNYLDSLTKKVCYPYWDHSKIQVDKSTFIYNNQFINLIEKFKKEKFYQSWISNFTQSMSLLDPNQCFINPNNYKDDLIFYIQFHSIGEFK